MTLFKLEIEVKLSHMLEDTVSSFGIGLWIWEGKEEVVYIDNKPSFGNHVSEGVVHESLEYGGGVVKAKEHDCQFEESFVCDEGCLPLMAIFNADIIVPPLNIEFGEMMSIFQLVYEVRYEREGVSIAGGVFVEIPIVLTVV